ncbi:MAG: RNA polymerase sigma factor [Candidatus Kapaibacterium sp.]
METHIREKQEQFLDLIEPHKAGLARFCRALSHDSDTAKDLASETILITYERFETLQNKAAIKGYLYTVASRLARTERKLAKRNTSQDEALSVEYTGASPGVLADIHLLQEALEKLPEKIREAIIMFEISGLSLAEITEIQGGSLSGVKMRIARGKRKLAKLLGVEDEVIRNGKSEVRQEFNSIVRSTVL